MVSTYAPCPDITATVTPDLKCPEGEGQLLWVSLGQGQCRLGGSALAQCYSQVGDVAPDLDSPEQLVSTFRVVQKLLAGGYKSCVQELVKCLLICSIVQVCGLLTCIILFICSLFCKIF